MKLRMIVTPGTIVAQEPKPLQLLPEHLSRHVFIGGGSGSGKSKLIELLCRQLASHECGFTYIDPHGDGVNAVLRHLAAVDVDPSRVYHLKPGTDLCFNFDPYADAPAADEGLDYQSWLTATVDRMIRAFLRNVALADMELMKRLRNWLSIILFAAGVDVDGRHLGLSDALILTNPERKEFDLVFDRVIDKLPPDYAAELRKLKGERSGQVRDKWMESTINMLREILKGPIVRLIFAQQAESFSLREAILKKKIVLLDLSETDALSRDQGNIIGGMLINFLLSTARRIPESNRIPHYLIVDEAENYLGEDLRMAFAELRKFLVSVCIAVQDLSSLRKGDLDLVNKVISQCGLQMTFQQGHPDDIEFLAKSFGYGSLDLTPLLTEQVLPDGYEWVTTMSVSRGENYGETESTSEGETNTQSTTRSRHTGASINESVSRALSEGHTDGTSESFTRGESDGESGGSSSNKSEGRTRGHSHQSSQGTTKGQSSSRSSQDGRSKGSVYSNDGELRAKSDGEQHGSSSTTGESSARSESHMSGSSESTSETQSTGVNKGWNRSRNSSHAQGLNSSESRSRTDSIGASRGKTEGRSDGESESVGQTHGSARGKSHGKSKSVSATETPLAKNKIVMRKTGHLVISVQDQLYEIMKTLASLPDRFVLVKCKGMPSIFALQVHPVLEPYEQLRKIRTAKWKADDLKRLLTGIRNAHACYFTPTKDDQAARLARFLGTPLPEATPRPPPFTATPAGGKNPFGDKKSS